jgi:hypothetical protein
MEKISENLRKKICANLRERLLYFKPLPRASDIPRKFGAQIKADLTWR